MHLNRSSSLVAGARQMTVLAKLRVLPRVDLLNPFLGALEACDGSGRRLLLAGLEEFREHLGGELNVTLLKEIGDGVEVHAMDVGLIERAIDWLRPQDAA